MDKTGGKILVYPHAEMELTAIQEFAGLAATDPRFTPLADICARHGGIWSEEAERYVLDTFTRAGNPALP